MTFVVLIFLSERERLYNLHKIVAQKIVAITHDDVRRTDVDKNTNENK